MQDQDLAVGTLLNVWQVQQLQHEITRMRAQQDFLKKKIKETTDKYEDEHDMHQKNMALLKRESENQLKRVRELEVCNFSSLLYFSCTHITMKPFNMSWKSISCISPVFWHRLILVCTRTLASYIHLGRTISGYLMNPLGSLIKCLGSPCKSFRLLLT